RSAGRGFRRPKPDKYRQTPRAGGQKRLPAPRRRAFLKPRLPEGEERSVDLIENGRLIGVSGNFKRVENAGEKAWHSSLS
ncbi:hypothetical protein ACFRAU_26000, partial [Arthrobacter sp. NPDC056691]|uniref:hypothetical protein n=1 Tax=Arthrobacter sp. NPDC056691 TaxID=3345913 RepID=UPI0036716D22